MAPEKRPREAAQLYSLEPDEDGLIITTSIPRWPDWVMRVEITRDVENRFKVTTCSIKPHQPDQPAAGGITAAMLRDVPVASVPALIARTGGDRHYSRLIEDFLGPDFAPEVAERKSKGGRPRTPLDVLALWAMRRVMARDSDPVGDLAERFHHNQRTIRSYLRRAQDEGLWLSAGQGRSGGTITAECVRVLEESSNPEARNLLNEYRKGTAR